MNIEFVKSADGNKFVTNENGEIFQSINSKRTLLLENKVELLNNTINELQHGNMINKSGIIMFKIVVALLTIMIFTLNVDFIKNFEGLRTILLLAPLDIIWPSVGLCTTSYLKKGMQENEILLEKTMTLKEDAEKELALAKEKQIDLSEERDIPVNEPISLVKENEREVVAIKNELEEYLANILQSQRGLTLSRKNKSLNR